MATTSTHLDSFSSFLFASGAALFFGIGSALIAIIGETALSFVNIPDLFKNLLQPSTIGFTTIIFIVIIEECSSFFFSRSFFSASRRWSIPFFLGLGFTLIEISLACLAQPLSSTILIQHFLPLLLLHTATFSLYVSHQKIAILSLLAGILFHTVYNALAVILAPWFVLLCLSCILLFISFSVFLARLASWEYTEVEVN